MWSSEFVREHYVNESPQFWAGVEKVPSIHILCNIVKLDMFYKGGSQFCL